MIVRNAVSVPPGVSQLILNFAISLCYILVGVLDVSVLSNLDAEHAARPECDAARGIGATVCAAAGGFVAVRRFAVTARRCCWNGSGSPIEEAEEFATREGQLHSAGRLAAEFAHQIKNPLAIINNAAFSLQRALRDGKTEAAQQIEIIQEEVSRADRIVTQIMGYAQLSEGRVEKLNVVEELDRAIAQVFPPAVPTGIRVHREFDRTFSAVADAAPAICPKSFLNLLKNAREAVGENGNVYVTAASHRDYSVEISVRDDGPGIPPDKIERIFEAYYTTKEHGTGLGLAIVKHNVELYGGTVRVESGLGKGATFTLLFPAKTLMQLKK